MPRWKRNPGAIPSIRLYSELQIKEKLPGEHNSHTFTRGVAVTGRRIHGNRVYRVSLLPFPADQVIATDNDNGPTDATAADQSLVDEFCRIMVHDKAHLNPPHELWTRNNLAQLDQNIGKALPLFIESAAKARSFEFVGWYRIKAWARCPGGGRDVLSFIQKRQVSQTARSWEYWEKALSEDWARVELEKVNDPALGNPMEKTA